MVKTTKNANTAAKRDKSIPWKDAFSHFFESPSLDRLRNILRNNLGEFDWIDFKAEWISRDQLARHILGMANSKGGALIVGVKETDTNSLQAVGLASFADKTDIAKGVRKYLPDSLEFDILDFEYKESEYEILKGKLFQVLLVNDQPESLPFVSQAAGKDIGAHTIYVRSGNESMPVNYVQLQRILNRRIETMHSTRRQITLQEHLDELRALYRAIPSEVSVLSEMLGPLGAFNAALSKPHPDCPPESYEAFVARMIEVKKDVIEAWLRQVTR